MQTLVSTRASAPLAPTRHPPKLIALGDSLVYGYGDWQGGGWVERLRRLWMHPHLSGPILYNLGVRGDGVGQVLQRLEAEFRHRGELRNRVPDGIILSVGLNDCARLGQPRGRNYTEYEHFCETLAHLLDRAQALCPVWVVGMIPVDEDKMPFLGCFYFNHGDQHRYNQAIQQACQIRGIPFLDLMARFSGSALDPWLRCLSEDGLHPNQQGYALMLEQVVEWLPQTQSWQYGSILLPA